MPRPWKRLLAPGVPAELGAAIALAGGPTALARVLQVSPVSVHRWMTGSRPLAGPALFAVRAIVAHPEDLDERKDG
jgi:DNA-binding transcriptional regulator YdaS (Cro superfamily)